MDFQAFVDGFTVPCAVLSVEKTQEGTCGTIRIVRANEPYRSTMGACGMEFVNDMAYDELVPKDIKFEDFCFRAAFCNQQLHTYVQTKALGTWTDQMLIPLQPASDTLGYCQFVFEFTKEAEPERMAAVSLDTAAAVVKGCLTLAGATDFDQGVGEVLEDLLQMSQALSCRILLVDHQKAAVTKYCERIKEDRGAWVFSNHVVPYEFVSQWDDIIGSSNAIIIKDKRDMEYMQTRCPQWVETMRRYGISSIVLVPLRRGDASIGYLYITNYNVERTVEIKELIELMSFFLSSEISNRLLLTRLEEMSNTDMLTGLQNRNSMIRRIGQMASSDATTPFGVINIDLNGLKATNDNYGHGAGDKLLVEAAELLRKVFYEEDLFRTGGDEFIVLATSISEETFDRKIERLELLSNKDNTVSFAMGTCWSDGSKDVRVAFLEADEHMYDNKREYYRLHPNMRRQ